MAEEAPSSSGGVEVTLRRDLGLLEVLMIGLGPNIGSTIFVLVGFGVAIAGPALILALVLNFIITIFTAFSYAELASAAPETGGGYLWVKEGLFPPFGFLGGWMSWVGHCIACGVYALGFGEGIKWLFQQYGVSFLGIPEAEITKIFAIIIAVAFSYLNFRGVKGAGRSEIFISVILLGVIGVYALFTIIALFNVGDIVQNFTPFLPSGDWLAVAAAMGFTFMIFEGYEIVAQTGEEAKDPERTIPKAMFICVTVSTVLFVFMATITIAVSGWQNVAVWGSEALARTAGNVVPILGAGLISMGVVIGSIAAVNSIIFSTSRVSFAMGRDGNLPSSFGKLHPKRQTPATAIFFSMLIIIAICVFLPIQQVASAADILILILFILVNISAITLRKRMPDAKRHFMIPFFPYVTVIAIGAKFFIAVTIFTIEPYAWWVAIAVMMGGLLLHYFAKGKKEIEKVELPERVTLTAEELSRYRVMIPVEDSKNYSLVDLGILVAQRNHGELLLLSVVEVATSVPLDAVSSKQIEEKKRMLEKLQVHAEAAGVVTRALVTVSHDVVTAVIDTAKEEHVNNIIIGWKGYTKNKKRILGRKMDAILKQTPCDVIFMREGDKLKPDKILVLSGGLWHVSKATELAGWIAKAKASRVVILNVIVDEHYMPKAREYSARLTDMLEEMGVQVITKEIRPETIVGGVIAESLDYDLLVIGTSAAKRWEAFDFGPIQDKMVVNSKCPVLVYKRVAKTADDQKVEEAEEE